MKTFNNRWFKYYFPILFFIFVNTKLVLIGIDIDNVTVTKLIDNAWN